MFSNPRRIAVAVGAALVVLTGAPAFASSVDVAVVDVTVPVGAVTLAPGASGPVTINMTVSGNQAGTATFEVYQDWTLSAGEFIGSNAKEFTVAPRVAQAQATTFSTSGTVSVATGQGAGTFTLRAAAVDITNSNSTGAKLTAGTASNYNVTVVVPSDTTPPSIVAQVSGTLGDNGWYTSDVAVGWAITDQESAVTSTTGCGPTTLDEDTPGTTVTCTASSTGGTSSQSVTIKRDATAPSIAAVLSPAAPDGTNDWYASAPTVHFTCTDATSGVATCSDDHTFAEGADQSHTGTLADNAGNTATVTVDGLDVDLTNPSISVALDRVAADSGWFNATTGAPVAEFTCSDATSGVAACPGDVTFGEGANQSPIGTVLDNAGHAASASVTDVDVDLTAPDVTWAGGPAAGGSYYFGDVPAAPTCDASDATSGVDAGGCTVTGYSPLVGTHLLTASAKDNAGNTTTVTRSYSVDPWTLSGYHQPVDMGPAVWNTVKGGSTVPLKFEVFAGAELTDVAVVDTFTVKGVACPATGVLTDDIELVTSGATALRYDPTAGQFIQNWQTPKKPGACYTVTMTTDDGSRISANVKLK